MPDSAERQPLNSATRAVLVNRLPEPHQQPQFNHNLAVVIGIDAYTGGIPRLTTAVNDAARLGGLLRDAHGYETILLTQPATGQPVTRERLRALFEDELKARLGDDDRLLVYFAGHGVALDGDDGPRGYLVPQDARPGDSASMLAMTDLHAWLTALPCRHMLAILDCCFAGAFRWSATRHMGALPKVIYKERYDRYLRSPAWQVLTSAAYDQKALDVLAGDAKRGALTVDSRLHSPFALALFEALANGEADLAIKGKRDGVITATELYHYLREQVEVQAEERASHEQTPGLWPLNKHRNGEFIFLAPGHPLNLPPAPDLTDELNPYRGLKSYDQQHAPLFFGREDEIKELVALVEQQPFLAVLGASGTGKSSLVKAGVLPRLEGRSDEFSRPAPAEATEVATTNETYRVLSPMRPTDQPVRALETLLRAELAENLAGLGDLPGLDLAHIIARWAEGHPNERLVLTIDQFEELATLCRDDAERERFLRLLAAAVEQQPAALRLIITLRTDFEPQFTQEGSPLANLWQSARLAKPPARYIVPPMDIEDLRQVIEGPAAVRVLYFDPPELVDDLIKEVIQTPGALPLLSFTLSELYVKYVQSGRDDRALSGADYKALGGVVGSLRNRATEEYDRLPDDAHRLKMQRLMLRMVAVEGGELARRRVALSELAYPTTEENARVQTVLDRLVAARLLVRGTSDPSAGSGQALDGAQGEAYVEPAHDALVLAWDKLLRWKKEAEEYLPLQRRLAQAAGEWSKAAPEAKPGLLWDKDPRLPQVEETLWPTDSKQKGLRGRFRWASQVLAPKTDTPTNTKWLNGAELVFVRTSVRARARFWQRVVSITGLVMIILSAVTVFALVQRSEANTQRDTAQRKQAEAEHETRRAQAGELAAGVQVELSQPIFDPSLALLLARQAVLTTWPMDGYVADNSDSALKAATERAEASSWRMTLPRHHHVGDINTAAFSPDGKQIVTAGVDQTARIWDVVTGKQMRLLTGHTGSVTSAAYSPDGKRIVTTSIDQTARIWDARSGKEIRRLTNDFFSRFNVRLYSAAYSPDGRTIVTGSDYSSIIIWDADTGQEVRTLSDWGELGGTIKSVVFSPNGEQVLSVGDQVVIWDASTGRELRRLQAYAANSAAYSPDGKHIVTAESDGIARIWDTTTGEELYRFTIQTRLPTNEALLARYRPDGKNIVTAHSDNSVRIWDATTGQEVHQLNGHTSWVKSAAYSPDGKTIVTASDDGTARIWEAATGEEVHMISGHTSQVHSAAYSPDGKHIVTADSDGIAWIWDTTTGLEVRQLRHNCEYRSWCSLMAAYSPDGMYIVTAGADKKAHIWDAATGLEMHILSGHRGDLSSVMYSPDGKYVVTASDDGTARIWDVAMGKEVRQLTIDTLGVNSAAYSPNGEYIVTTSFGGAVRIWDAATGKEVRQLTGHVFGVNSAAYSPNGRHIVTANSNGTATIFDVITGQEVRQLTGHGCDEGGKCAVSSAVYSPDGKRIITASSGDRTARIWDAETGKEIRQLNGHGCKIGTSYGVNGETDNCSINSAVYSPNGMYILTAGDDGTARIWDAGANWEVRQLNGHTGWVGSAAYSPDGKHIVTSGSDGTTRIWDVIMGQEMHQLTGYTGQVFDAAYSPNGTQIVTAGEDNTVRIWDAGTGREVSQLDDHTDYVGSAAYSTDGKHIITASGDGTIRIWDAATGEEERQVTGGNIGAFSPDGKYIITAGDYTLIVIWDTNTGQEVRQLIGHTDSVLSAVYSPDGRYIVSAGIDTVRVWDADTGQEVQGVSPLEGHFGRVNSAEFSPDSSQIVTAGDDGTARIWDAATGQELRVLRGHNCDEFDNCGVISAAFSPDGTQIVTSGADGTVRIWNARTQQDLTLIGGHANWVTSAAFSPDGKQVVTASADHTARIWNVDTGQETQVLTGHTDLTTSPRYSPDGKYVVTASTDNSARIWDATTGLIVRVLTGHTGAVYSAAFNSDGRQIITASGDHSARIWDAGTGQEVLQISGHTNEVNSAAFSPDGTQIVTAGADGTARLWDVKSGQEVRQLTQPSGCVAMVNSYPCRFLTAAYSPNGKLIAASVEDEDIDISNGHGWVGIWDARSGHIVRQLSGHSGLVFSVVYSSDGKLVATASDDGTIRIWDVSSGQEMRRLVIDHGVPMWSAAFSPDSRQIITAGNDEIARIWDIKSGHLIALFSGSSDASFPAIYGPDGKHIVTYDPYETATNLGTADRLAEAGRLIQRDPPLLTPEDRQRYGLE